MTTSTRRHPLQAEPVNRIDSLSKPRSLLLHWDHLPEWQQDNRYIHTHYRHPSYSFLRSFQSLFYLNNESVNIHSHLWAALFFAFFGLSIYLSNHSLTTSADVLAFAAFFGGATLCLGISACYHTISNHSSRVNQLANQLDYVGIVALITGSFLSSLYYGFYCDPMHQKIYWTMVRHASSLNNEIILW